MTNKQLTKQFKKCKSAGMNMVEVARIKAIAKKETEKMQNDAIEKGFIFASYLFLNVLLADYWQKSGKTKVPKLMKEVFSLYDSFMNNTQVITYKEMRDYVEKESGYKMECVWFDEE